MDQTSRGKFYRVHRLTSAEVPILNVKKIDNYYFHYDYWDGASEQAPFSSCNSMASRLQVKKKILGLDPAHDPTGVYTCLQCGHDISWPQCDINCYKAFRKQHFKPAEDKIEIQVADPNNPGIGDGVFVKPGQSIAAAEYLGEYIGELLPLDAPNSFYSYLVDALAFPTTTAFTSRSIRPTGATGRAS